MGKIKEMAVEKGHIPEIKITKVDSMGYGIAHHASANVVEETVQLPARLIVAPARKLDGAFLFF